MKNPLKQKAIRLRTQDFSIGEISKLLRKSKSTILHWVKDIPYDQDLQRGKALNGLNKRVSLTTENIILSLRKQNKTIHEISIITETSSSTVCRVLKRLQAPKLSNRNHRDLKISKWQNEAKIRFSELKNDPLFFFGLGLYWGEGTKSDKSSTLSICNSDFGIIGWWLKWCNLFIPNRGLSYIYTIAVT